MHDDFLKIPTFDKEEALERLDNNQELFAKVLKMFLSKTPIEISKLKEVLNAENLEKVAFHAHTIKGSAGILGAKRISSISERIEKLAKTNEMNANFQTLIMDIEEALNDFIKETSI
jgi:HPt (histidine-containing phosphotransfer) domain-containing protein